MSILQPGSVFAGRYRVERGLATGGMGEVYEVVHLETDRRRALKVMQANLAESPTLRDRFKIEARAAAKIDSEYIVDVFDAGIDESTGMPFLVMELLRGEELGKRLVRLGRLAIPEVLVHLSQTALALDKTHRAGIVHRDLKPQNLFLTMNEGGPPRVKVLDFGVAKLVAETATESSSTRSLGTPLYMAPEQFRAQKVTPASDNYALAMVAYSLIVGEPYWAPEASEESDVIAFALTATMGPQESASARAGRKGVVLPPGFDAWFARATSVDPAKRFPGAIVMIQELRKALGVDGHPAAPQPATKAGPPVPLSTVVLQGPLNPAMEGTRAPEAMRGPRIAHASMQPGFAGTPAAAGSAGRGAGPAPGTPAHRPVPAKTFVSGSAPVAMNVMAASSATDTNGSREIGASVPPKPSSMTSVIVAIAAVVVLGLGGTAALFFVRKNAHATPHAASVDSRADDEGERAPSDAAPSSSVAPTTTASAEGPAPDAPPSASNAPEAAPTASEVPVAGPRPNGGQNHSTTPLVVPTHRRYTRD